MGKRQARKARRKQRKQLRKLRRANIKTLRNLAKDMSAVDLGGVWQDEFSKFWPVLKQALVTVRDLRITGLKTDNVLDDIIEYGNALYLDGEQQTAFTDAIQPVWALIAGALEVVTLFTGAKATAVIDDIIEIGDWITQTEDTSDVALALV